MSRYSGGNRVVNLLPGPVAIPQEAREAFCREPVSHRAASFLEEVDKIRRLLCEMVGARRVEILSGSGTLANDVVAAQLAISEASVLIVSNGEFGERLVDHARRLGVAYDVVEAPWGTPPPYTEIENRLSTHPKLDWLWSVHCETSTGVLSDLGLLARIAADHNVRLCVDAVSSIGTVPVDLRHVHLATGVSGKGLGSYSGLAMVYHHNEIRPSPRVARYLDLGSYAAADGVPFTQNSNLFQALKAALTRFQADDGSLNPDPEFAHTASLGRWLRRSLKDAGIPLMGDDENTSPAVTTIALPPELDSEEVGRRAEEAGFLLHYRSGYLVRRNLLQMCLMGQHSYLEMSTLVEILRDLCRRRPSTAGSAVLRHGRH